MTKNFEFSLTFIVNAKIIKLDMTMKSESKDSITNAFPDLDTRQTSFLL